MAISRILELFNRQRDEDTEEARDEAIRLATAAVLLEVANAGSEMGEAERQEVVGHLRSAFSLDDASSAELLAAAADLRSDTIDHFHLTNQVRRATERDERMQIVEAMWRIVYADGKFHQYEGYIVRKLSDLLGLEHAEMIDAKMRVRDQMGLAP